MAYSFNPFTGKLDDVGAGGGGTTDASLLTSGTLADARLSANVALDNTANTFTAGQTIASGVLTASSPALAITQTWNSGATTFTGMRVNVTDTASAASSLLADFQTSGTSCFTVNKLGSTSGSGGFSFTPAANTGTFSFASGSTGGVQFNRGGTNIFAARADSITTFNFGASFAVGWNGDTYLYRDAANTLAQRNAANAQTFRVYNTYTDASNYERGFMRWNANTLEIGTEAGGTGTVRNVSILNQLTVNNAILASDSFQLTSGGIYIRGNTGVCVSSSTRIGFSSGVNNANVGPDTSFSRNAAGVVEINNGTAGTFRDLRVRNVIQQSGIGTTVTPANNGDLVIEQTSNSSITFKMKGTDGVVRSGMIALI